MNRVGRGFAAGLAMSVLPLSACATGEVDANSYEAVGTVDKIGNESFHLTDITVVDGNEVARDRLADGETIHDNYRDFNCIGHETSNDFDEVVDDGTLAIGSVVRISATVGRSQYRCVGFDKNKAFFQDRSLLRALKVIEG